MNSITSGKSSEQPRKNLKSEICFIQTTTLRSDVKLKMALRRSILNGKLIFYSQKKM